MAFHVPDLGHFPEYTPVLAFPAIPRYLNILTVRKPPPEQPDHGTIAQKPVLRQCKHHPAQWQ